jgi:hypothetical protein
MTGDGEKDARVDGEMRMEMDKKVDCQFFEDQLDALVRGELPDEGGHILRLHADSCPTCAMQLKVQEHLLGPSLEELEAQVPEQLLAGMWDHVNQGITDRGTDRGEAEDTAAVVSPARGASIAKRSLPAFKFLVPTLAAACVALLFSTGFLASELSDLQEREAGLAQQITEQQQWLAELGGGSSDDPVIRTAALAGRNPFARALSREETISISGLQSLLERMPGDRTVLSRAQLDAVLRNRAGLSQPLLREALAGIDARDGVQARDLIRALDAMEVGPGFTVPTADLMEILS